MPCQDYVNMRIAVFHYKITKNNPTGNCLLQMIEGLYHEHDFTIFSIDFQNPCPDRIRCFRIPAPSRPLALLFVAFHALAPLCYLINKILVREEYDLVIFTESRLYFGDVSYAHFCHRAYLRYFWSQLKPRGLRKVLRYLNHRLHALMEPWCFSRSRHIVVPSQGLRGELEKIYPFVTGKVTVIANPVNLQQMRPSLDFDRETFRRTHGAKPDDLVLVFVALGNFEHKGLPLIIEALCNLSDPCFKLWVVGGMPDLVSEWKKRVQKMGLAEVQLFGVQRDVRPYLWGADVFVLPSLRETFPLVSLEAAAAGLPLIVTPVYGVEEFMVNGEMGFVVDRSAASIAEALRRFLSLSPEERRAMGSHAQRAVRTYAVERFIANWRRFLSDVE